ncbi:MAG: hypothetical protein ABI579_07325 [Candidatus Sumerlaeota bacterium]
MPTSEIITGLTNQEFLDRYARPGMIGLAGGGSISSKLIARAQRHIDEDHIWSKWSHAFLLEGTRADNHHWVVESDLHLQHKRIRLGVQENRLRKYYDQDYYATIALLDFNLTEEQFRRVLTRALDFVADNTQYSMREIVGLVLGLRHPSLRKRDNLFSQSTSFFCSAFVSHLFREAGLPVSDSLTDKHVTPEDIFRSLAPHSTIILERAITPTALEDAEENSL